MTTFEHQPPRPAPGRRDADAVAAAIMDAAPEGFGLFGTDFRYLHVNEALARINGVPAPDHIGRTLWDIVPGLPEEQTLGPLRQVLETGRPVVDLEVRGNTPADPDDERTWLVSYFPIRDAAGSIARLGAIVTDITDRTRAEERAGLLAELGAILDEVVDLDERLERFVGALVPRFGDVCSVALRGDDRPPHRAGTPTPDGERIVVPMYAAGRVLGELTLERRAPRRWTPHELELVDELARRAAVTIETARLYASERGARERMARLQAVTAAVSEALTPTDVARAVLDEGTVSIGASMAAIWQLDGDGTAFELIGHRGWGERSSRTPMARIDAAAALPVPDAVRKRRPVWLPDLEAKAAAYPALAQRAVGTSPEALYVLPLTSRTEPVGALALCFDEPERLDAETTSFAAALAAQCAQALERARLYEAEHELAATLQRSMLPTRLPQMRDVEFAVRYLPAAGLDAGGDFYEALELPSGAIGVAVGDVVGRGAAAAAVMGQLRSALRAYALQGAGPAEVLTRLSAFAESVDGGLAATAAYAVIDPAAGTLRYACAGHPYPLLARPAGTAQLLRDGRSVPLGVGGPARYHEAEVALEAGATLLLYTDGLVERRDESFDDGLEDLVASVGTLAGAPLAELLEEVVRGRGADARLDDVALLAVRLSAGAGPVRRLRIPAEPAAVAGARAELRAWLAEAGITGDRATDLLLAAGEALANAVEHAYAGRGGKGDVGLELRVDERAAELTVSDRGRWRGGPGDPHRGRGMEIMRTLMDHVDVVPSATGSRVVLRAFLSPAASGSPAPPAPAGASADPSVRLAGDVDLATAPAVEARLAALDGDGPLAVDLRAVVHVDSTGLRMLVEVAKRRGGLAVIAPPGSAPRRALDVAGLGGVLEIRDA